MRWEVSEGDCVELMRAMPESCVDAIVCDPPYDLLQSKHGNRLPQFGNGIGAQQERAGRGTKGGFMGMTWDGTGVAFDPVTWAAALRVAKPGAYLLAFGGTRTFHRMAVAIEDAGWEIRDTISWLYASGFPKSHNLDGDWDGWGTALKPAWEPIIVARKPLIGTVAANVQEYGTGALNIDGSRIGTDSTRRGNSASNDGENWRMGVRPSVNGSESGRWPANVALDEGAAAMLDQQSGDLRPGSMPANRNGSFFGLGGTTHGERIMLDGGGASRFFYVAKPSRAERQAGWEKLPEVACGTVEDHSYDWQGEIARGRKPRETKRRNPHPTVKPITLMRHLVRLVTPPGGVVLDPFTGSGTTGCAAMLEGFDFLGMEQSAEYIEIAKARISHFAAKPRQGGLL